MGTPIVAVTAHAFKEEQERLLASGMDDYLPKPIEVELLITLINSWCHNVEPGEIVFPSIDWQLALKRANQNQDTAKEMLTVLLRYCPKLSRHFRRFGTIKITMGLRPKFTNYTVRVAIQVCRACSI